MIVLDPNGRIDGLAPGDAGFLARALRSGRRHIPVCRGEQPGMTLPGGDRDFNDVVLSVRALTGRRT